MDWLDQLDVEYEIVDAERLLKDKTSGIKSVPATEIDEKLIFGFDRPAILNALKQAGLISDKNTRKKKAKK